jgi:hypothetical protein
MDKFLIIWNKSNGKILIKIETESELYSINLSP